MAKSFISGAKGEKPRSDLRVKYTPSRKPLSISVKSSVDTFFGEAIKQQTQTVCKDLKISSGSIEIEDFGALPKEIVIEIIEVKVLNKANAADAKSRAAD